MQAQAKTTLLLTLGIAPSLALAQVAELELRLERCAVLGDASARLACYDGLTQRAPEPAAPPPAPQVPPAVAALTTLPKEQTVSRMVQEWELDRAAKRGVFNFRPHKDSYLLLANYSTSSNDAPFQDFTPAGIKSKHVELTYQLSFKMKLAEQLMNTPVDLWFGYTQNSFWQAYNRAASSPFRETNYQPELMLTSPLNLKLGPLDVRYLTLALNHQSNGQTSTLSRSWNRVYAEMGAERGQFSVAFRLWKRLDNARSNNDNFDIADYMGHGDLQASYRFDGNELSLMARHNFGTGRGALRLGWAFPLVANLKGYVQGFSGYGQSLIDYNYSQKSIGAGFLVEY